MSSSSLRRPVMGLSVLLFLSAAGCQTSSVVQHRLPDTERQMDAQVNRARFVGENVADMVTLHRNHVRAAIAYLNGFPERGPGQKHADLGWRERALMALSDRDTELLSRITDQGGLVRVDPNEINALTAHLDLRVRMNRMWVGMNEPDKNPDAVLRTLPQPAPWTRTALSQRGLSSDGNLAILMESRLHQMNYASLTKQIVDEAKRRGLSRANYWQMEHDDAALLSRIVTSDVYALRRGEMVTEGRCAATYDMVEAMRHLYGDRAAEVYGPVLAARTELNQTQAQQLLGSSWTDTDALARFRGWWMDRAPKAKQARLQKGSAQDPNRLWLDELVDKDPEMLAIVWWGFRSIPLDMFNGPGATLPEPVAKPGDSETLSSMLAQAIGSQPAQAQPDGQNPSHTPAQGQ